MTFEVVFAEAARADLERLHEYLLTHAETVEELGLADRTVDEIELACKVQLARIPHLFRKAGTSLTRRELVITFGATGVRGAVRGFRWCRLRLGRSTAT